MFVVPLVAMIKRDDQRAADAKPRVEDFKQKLERDELPDDMLRHGTERVEHRIAAVSADIEFRISVARLAGRCRSRLVGHARR